MSMLTHVNRQMYSMGSGAGISDFVSNLNHVHADRNSVQDTGRSYIYKRRWVFEKRPRFVSTQRCMAKFCLWLLPTIGITKIQLHYFVLFILIVLAQPTPVWPPNPTFLLSNHGTLEGRAMYDCNSLLFIYCIHRVHTTIVHSLGHVEECWPGRFLPRSRDGMSHRLISTHISE